MTIRAASLVLSLLAHGTAFLYFSSATLPHNPVPVTGEALRVTVVHAGESPRLPVTPQQDGGNSAVSGGHMPEKARDWHQPTTQEAAVSPSPTGQGVPGAIPRKSRPPAVEESRVVAIKDRPSPIAADKVSVTSHLPQDPSASKKPEARTPPKPRLAPPKTPLPQRQEAPELEVVDSKGGEAVALAKSEPEPEPLTPPTPTHLSQHRASIESEYTRALLAAIEKHKRYPLRARRRGEQGVVEVLFTVQRDGTISEVRVVASSHSPSLDRAASGALTSLARFDPIPPQLERDRWQLQVPIRFALR